MTHMRREFSEATKRQALERAAAVPGNPRCQDPLCGVSEEWTWLREDLKEAWIMIVPAPDGFTLTHLESIRDGMLAQRSKHPRALNPIIRRFKLDGGALLEVDHEREDADGGGNGLDNAVVRCVFCHAFKTQARGNSRRRAPKKPERQPEQLNVLTHATVRGLQGKIDAVKLGMPKGRNPERGAPVGVSPRQGYGERQDHTCTPDLDAQPRERRHHTDAEVTAAVQRREQAIEDNWFGV